MSTDSAVNGAGSPVLVTFSPLVLSLDTGGNVVFASPSVREWLEVLPEQVIGHTIEGLRAGSLSATLASHLATALAGTRVNYDIPFGPAGATREARVNLTPKVGAGGSIEGLYLVVTDLSAVRAHQQVDIDTAAVFEDAFESAATGMALMSLEGRWLRANPALCAMVGYTEAELRTMHFSAITHPDDCIANVEQTRRVTAGELPNVVVEKRYLHKSGRLVYVYLTLALVRDRLGRPQVNFAQVVDITARRQAEAALRESEMLFRAVSETAPVGIFVDSAEGQCTYINAAYQRMAGLPRERLLGRGWLDSLHPDDLASIETLVDNRANHGYSEAVDQRFLHPDGRLVLARVRTAVLRDGERILGAVGVVEDVTEARQAQERIGRLNAELEERVLERTRQLQEAKQRLERTNHDLNQFSYSLAHDLRTPIRAIASFTDLLRADYGARLDDTGREYLDRIGRAVGRADLIVEALLGLARTGSIQLARRPLDLPRMAREAIARLHQEHPGTDAQVEIEPVGFIHADPRLLPALLDALLGNAWKFAARAGQPRIRLGQMQTDAGPAYFIRDNGIGFDPQHAGKLFQPFQRLHNSPDYPGTGIGLAMAKRIVDLHGGSLWAHSTPGQGATFYFMLEPAVQHEGEAGAASR